MGRLAERRARAAPPAMAAMGPARASHRSRDVFAAPGAIRLPARPVLPRTAQSASIAVTCFRSWLVAEGWYEIEVDAALRIRHATRGGLACLGAALGAGGLRSGTRVPAACASLLRRNGAGAPAANTRSLAQGRRQFTLRALPAVEDDGWLLYVGERGGGAHGVAPAAAPGGAPLSPREREVLDWVAAGKTDAQAAAILGISVRTVQKHLENAYVKLGVEGRTAAVMRVRAATARR